VSGARGQAEGRAVTHVERAGLPVAALSGFGAITDGGGDAREGGDAKRGRFGNEGRRQIVDEAALDDHGAAILDGEFDLGFTVEGGGVGPGARGDELGGLWETLAIEERRGEDE
jgi:hypothetical protein